MLASAVLPYLENVILTAHGKFLQSQDVSKDVVPCTEVFWIVEFLPLQQTERKVDPDRDQRIFYCHIFGFRGVKVSPSASLADQQSPELML